MVEFFHDKRSHRRYSVNLEYPIRPLYRELAPLSVSGWRMSLDISDSTNSGLIALLKKMLWATECSVATAQLVESRHRDRSTKAATAGLLKRNVRVARRASLRLT